MLLQLNHKKLKAYEISRALIKEVYQICQQLPSQEKYNLCNQIQRAAVSIKLNIAEGASRKSLVERKRYYEIARGSLIELDAAIETAIDLQFLQDQDIKKLSILLNQVFSLLCGLITQA